MLVRCSNNLDCLTLIEDGHAVCLFDAQLLKWKILVRLPATLARRTKLHTHARGSNACYVAVENRVILQDRRHRPASGTITPVAKYLLEIVVY